MHSNQLLEQTAILKVRLNERISGIRFDRPFSTRQIKHIGGSSWQSILNCPDYLRRWFTEPVLVQLAAILKEIERLPSKEIQMLMRVILSDIIRSVSLQDSADLRIRRRKSPPDNEPAIPLFLDSLSKKLYSILKTRQLINPTDTTQVAFCCDALRCRKFLGSKKRQVGPEFYDAAITSPPYASALPYIDTQRLSLVLLGLIDAYQIRDTERQLIGNREITPAERSRLEIALADNLDVLPQECVSFCQLLQNAVNKQRDGFRRENVPALLYKYLAEMAEMFRQVYTVLKKGAQYALIVGRNSTRLGGQNFTIDTPRLLVVLAKANGFKHNESVELETYHRFDVHQANSIRSETLILLGKE
jgi:site-specific DNA-methyltransferase (cytosine-N4-specific)